jgi:molecular chaperone DnaJ
VHVRGGDVAGDGFGWRERPIRTLTSRARFFSENVGVRFTAVVMVVPEDAGIDVPTEISRLRGLSAIIVNRSDVAGFLRLGIPGVMPVNRDAVAAAAEHLRRSVQFV